MSKKQTPLQEAIHWFQTEPEAIGRWNTADIVTFLQPFLKKEQQTFSDIWDAGSEYGSKDYRFDYGQITKQEWELTMNKTEFLNQWKPEVK